MAIRVIREKKKRREELNIQREAGMLLGRCTTESVNLLYLPPDGREGGSVLFHGNAGENKKSG